MATTPALAVCGTAFHAPTTRGLEVLHDVTVGVDAAGTIVAIAPNGSSAAAELVAGAAAVERLTGSQRLLPGLVDLHIHAPQWPQLGTGLDLPLEEWLLEHTFPLEARYADERFAESVWEHIVPTLLGCGTTTAVYYSSIHERATEMLAEQCVRSGQRAFVGRVGMDHPQGTPEWYRDGSATAGIDASARSVDAIRRVAGRDPLVQPILTPRFVPACTDELLRGMGELAASTGVRVQTHCSESDWQHRESIARYGRSDAAALDSFGLVRRGSVLAHGDLLGDEDLALIVDRGAGIAHCPLSNAYFGNAVFPTRHALTRGVQVGLGTDVAGGAHPGLLSQCAMAVTASRMLEDGVDAAQPSAHRGRDGSRIDIGTAFHLATAGGAAVLGIPVGSFSVGYHFDAIVVDTAASNIGLRCWDDIDSEQGVFEKIVRLAGPAELTAVWVAGRRLVG